MQIEIYQESSHSQEWDQLVSQSWNGTFMHTRRFLAYHGERFRDRSLLIRGDDNRLLAVFPAAEHPSDNSIIISHPGLSYGGLVQRGELMGESVITAINMITDHYKQTGFKKVKYKVAPYIYHRPSWMDDLYAFFRCGWRRYRCDLSATVDLGAPLSYSGRRIRGRKKAVAAGIEVTKKDQAFPELWEVLSDNLQRRHGVNPVHSLKDMELLAGLFPNEIECYSARLGAEVLAGTVLFKNPVTTHSQYIFASEKGNSLSALDLLFPAVIEDAKAEGKRYFDFGICNEHEGTVLNGGLYEFKLGFGAGGTHCEFYEIEI